MLCFLIIITGSPVYFIKKLPAYTTFHRALLPYMRKQGAFLLQFSKRING